MKKILLTLLLLHCIRGFSQNRLIGIWNHITEPYIYNIYIGNNIYGISDFTYSKDLKGIKRISKSKYGFSDSYFEDEVILDSLTLTEKNTFYYYENDDFHIHLYCYIDTIYYKNSDTILRIESSNGMRTQYAKYKKLNILPRHVEDFLKEEEPEVYADYIKVATNRGVIKIKKSIIHNDKKSPTKKYLVKGDVIEILERKDKWYRIRFTNNKRKITEGWIKSQDIN